GLIAYWKFDEEGGYETFDSMSNSYRGILRGDPIWVEGLFDSSGVMLGKNQSIEIPDFVDPVNEDGKIENLSISFWLQAPQKEGGICIDKWTQAPESGWQVTNFGNEGWARFSAVIDGDGRKDASSHWGGPLMFGDGFEWHHVVCIYDGEANTMSVYVDDVPVPKLPEEINEKYIIPSESVLTIHGPTWGGDSNFQSYDEVAIWNRALTRQEITTLFNNTNGVEIPYGSK
ncbi:LamG domain-containing protein, partial [Candidatus Poribacteria bacterium]